MALTKVTLIQDGVITSDHLHVNHGITTDNIGEGSNLFYTDARVASYLAANNYQTSAAGYFTGVTHDTVGQTLTFSKSNATTEVVSLAQYIDDTNLARLTSGTVDAATGIATFTRDDATTFTVDFSSLLDDTDDYVNSASFNTLDGVLTLNRLGGGTVTVDLDGRYLTSETDSQTLTWTDATNTLSISNGNSVTITGFADASHTHDDRYYTEAESDARFQPIGSYAAASHSHPYLPLSGGTLTGSVRFNDTTYFGDDASNSAEVQIICSNAGSPQINFTESGDMSWGIGGDDADNSFKIHGVANANIPVINNIGNAFFEIETTGNLLASGNKIWHAGNDGSGSGLDADLLDGYDSVYYFRARGGIGGTDVTPGTTTAWPNNPAGGTYTTDYVGHGGTVIMSNDVGGSAGSIGIEATYYGDMYIHSNTDSSNWNTKRVWTEYNFDPNSKLGITAKAADSNLLDGIDSSQFVRSDADDTITGFVTFLHDSGVYIKTTTNGAGATIRFSDQTAGYGQNGTLTYYHSDGAVTTTGLTSNDGWIFNGSEANTVVKVNGYLQATGATYSQTHYDYNNTGYYVDPASTSNLNSVTTDAVNGFKLGIRNTSPSTKQGISLYGGASSGEPTYGMMFSGTAYNGTHGSVTSDWATYFTMSNSATRGWIFRRAGVGNYASISANGVATFDDSVRTPKFYDSNNTSRYIDPSSTIDSVVVCGGITTYSGGNGVASLNAWGVSGSYSCDFFEMGSFYFGVSTYTGENFCYNLCNGALYIGGSLYQNYYSDCKYKENITPIESALDKIDGIRGVEFDWNALGAEEIFKEGHEVGVIAQEVQAVYPHAVREVSKEREDKVVTALVVDQEKLIPLLLQGIKELKAEVNMLKAHLNLN